MKIMLRQPLLLFRRMGRCYMPRMTVTIVNSEATTITTVNKKKKSKHLFIGCGTKFRIQ